MWNWRLLSFLSTDFDEALCDELRNFLILYWRLCCRRICVGIHRKIYVYLCICEAACLYISKSIDGCLKNKKKITKYIKTNLRYTFLQQPQIYMSYCRYWIVFFTISKLYESNWIKLKVEWIKLKVEWNNLSGMNQTKVVCIKFKVVWIKLKVWSMNRTQSSMN